MVTQEENKSIINAVSVNKKVLISQAKPDSDKSPYYDLERKYQLELVFHPFIKLEAIPAIEFRKQKVDLTKFSSIILTSRNAVDHYFRICTESRRAIDQETKYFCITEAVGLYLQKFIQFRKRRIFFGAEGNNKSLFEVINKHRTQEQFLYVCSENQQDSDIVNWLKTSKCTFKLAYMYRSISNDVKALFETNHFDVICLFTPSGVRSMFDNYPDFKQNGTVIGTFGENTNKAVIDAGLIPSIVAPNPQTQSMVAAMDKYFAEQSKLHP
jgi:uroporphyrinogen-III synthase